MMVLESRFFVQLECLKQILKGLPLHHPPRCPHDKAQLELLKVDSGGALVKAISRFKLEP